MKEAHPQNEAGQAREILTRLGDADGPLARAMHVLALVTLSYGLGEVLRDYAVQTHGQLRAILRAAENALRGDGASGDRETLASIHFTLKSVKSVLEMVPAAMQRNKLEFLGEKERLSGEAITEITGRILSSKDITHLLAAEDAGDALAALVTEAEGSFAPQTGNSTLATTGG